MGAVLLCWNFCVCGQNAKDNRSEYRLEVQVLSITNSQPIRAKAAQSATQHEIKGWINRHGYRVTASTNISAFSAERPFVTLRNLLEAYRRKDMEAVINLYEEDSRVRIREILRDENTKMKWLEWIASIENFEPLVIWENEADICCMMYATRSGVAPLERKFPYPVVFTRNYELKAGNVSGNLASDLGRYFADGRKQAIDLVAGQNPTNAPTGSQPR